jgi:hypothetical protein
MIGESQEFWKKRRKITQRLDDRDRVVTRMEAAVRLPLWLTRLPNDELGVEVKKLVSRGIMDLITQKNKPTQTWLCVVHTSSAEGLEPGSKHGTYRIVVEYIGFYQDSVHKDMNALIRACRKRIADTKAVKNIISTRRKKSA